MKVAQAIALLQMLPEGLELMLDSEDGIRGNYIPVLGFGVRDFGFGQFVTVNGKPQVPRSAELPE